MTRKRYKKLLMGVFGFSRNQAEFVSRMMQAKRIFINERELK